MRKTIAFALTLILTFTFLFFQFRYKYGNYQTQYDNTVDMRTNIFTNEVQIFGYDTLRWEHYEID